MSEPAAAGFSLKALNTGFTRVKATLAVLPFSILSVASPSVALSGMVSLMASALSNSTPAAPGRSMALTRLRSFPLMVSTLPALTGAGEAASSEGTTVSYSPATISTPLLATSTAWPSCATAGSTKVISLLPAFTANSTLSAPGRLRAATYWKFFPLILTVAPAMYLAALIDVTSGCAI